MTDYNAIVESAFQLLDSYYKDASFNKIEEREGVSLYEKTVEGSVFTAAKAAGKIPNTTPKELIQLIADPSKRALWYDQIKKQELIEQVTDNIEIINFAWNAPFGVKNRDDLIVRSYKATENGELRSIGKSVTHPKCPVNPEFERLETLIAGFVLSVDKEDPNSVYCTYIIHTDPKGWVPAFVANKQKSKIIDRLLTFRKIVSKK